MKYDEDFLEDLIAREGNYQCYYCGGWKWFCLCELEGEEKEIKNEIKKYLEEIGA